ncbi:MAG: hypothetical protein ACREIT_06120 [Tepidisphaeraceae bacterium]
MRKALVVSIISLTTGCYFGPPKVPAGWSVSAPTSLAPTTAPSQAGRLQIIICYGRGSSTHACLRLESPGDAPIFWDPGGQFGIDPYPYHQRKDGLVVEPIPTLSQYWDFRTGYQAERYMEVFEWDLGDTESRALHDRMTLGEVRTAYPGGMCAIAVCNFLRQCAPRGARVAHSYLLPHSLAAHLWTQKPDRVWEYVRGTSPVAYVVSTPPGPPPPPANVVSAPLATSGAVGQGE